MCLKVKMDKHKLWVIGLIIIVLIICGTAIWLLYNSWTISFEMDDNTLEAIKSINWSELGGSPKG